MFETTYAKLNNLLKSDEFSQRHIEYSCSRFFLDGENVHGFNRNPGDGGTLIMSAAYWTSGKGPILENDMPFVDTREKIYLSEIENKKVQAQLEDLTIYPNIFKEYNNGTIKYSNGLKDGNRIEYSAEDIKSFRESVKEQIINYGSIGASTYMPENLSEVEQYITKKNGNFSYYCDNTSFLANHAISIIGWDDEYSKNNFLKTPSCDGAYIAMNSWGEKLSYFYISYDDFFVEQSMYGIQGISDVDYDNIYQYDEFGMCIYLNPPEETLQMYGANVFHKKGKLAAVGTFNNFGSCFFTDSRYFE